jgi:hypothetical protein
LNGEKKQQSSTMVCLGDGDTTNSHGKTVGLPVAALRILNGQIQTYGVQIPILKEIYEPIFKNWRLMGRFQQRTRLTEATTL